MNGSSDRRGVVSSSSGVNRSVSVMAAGLTSPPSLWRAFTGYGLWALCFTVLYAGHALGCVYGYGVAASSSGAFAATATTTGLFWLLTAIWMFFVLWLMVLFKRNRATFAAPEAQASRRSARFMVVLTFVADLSAVAITVISGLPVLLTPVCA